MKKRYTIPTMAVALMAIAAGPGGAPWSATLSGAVGDTGTLHQRYVGDPAPDGYTANYAKSDPYVLTESPEETPVTMAGTIDVSAMSIDGSSTVIGLYDRDSLASGERGNGQEVGMYIAYAEGEDSPTYRVGVTDGAAGGEWVQEFHTFSADHLDAGMLKVQFVVDGSDDPAGCASDAADVASAAGCMTLTVNGHTVTDSYGSIRPDDSADPELSNGAHPGWYVYSPDNGPRAIGVAYDLTVSPVVVTAPRTADDCRKGGFAAFEFKNQGQCVSSVEANENAGK